MDHQPAADAAVLSFLSGSGQFTSSFNFALANVPFQGGYVLDGTPVTPSPYYTHVLFYVDAGTSQIPSACSWSMPQAIGTDSTSQMFP